MIAAQIDEPRRILLEAKTHCHLWLWVVNLLPNICQLMNNTEAGQVLSLPVGYVTQLGFELAMSRVGLCELVGLLKDRPLRRRHQTEENLFTQWVLVRVIGNSKCCQHNLCGLEYHVLDTAHSY